MNYNKLVITNISKEDDIAYPKVGIIIELNLYKLGLRLETEGRSKVKSIPFQNPERAFLYVYAVEKWSRKHLYPSNKPCVF